MRTLSILILTLATLLGNAVDGTGLPALAKTYEEGIQTLNKSVLDRVSRKMIPAEGAEGWYLMARLRGVPELDGVVVKLRGSLDLSDELAQEAADEALGRVGRAAMNVAEGATPGHLRAIENAAANVRRPFDSHLRGLASDHIGRNADGSARAFANMEEFEFARTLPADSLSPAQKDALRQIRESVIAIGENTPIARVVPFDGQFGAMAMIQNGNPNLGGSITRQTDLAGAQTTRQVMDRLGLEYDPTTYADTLPYAVIETNATVAMRDLASIPTVPGAMGGAHGWSNVYDTLPNGAQVPRRPPFTGNGFTASTDGRLTPEWVVPPTPMRANETVMKFKNPDGSPMTVSMGQAGASDRWALRSFTDANNVERFRWEPMP